MGTEPITVQASSVTRRWTKLLELKERFHLSERNHHELWIRTLCTFGGEARAWRVDHVFDPEGRNDVTCCDDMWQAPVRDDGRILTVTDTTTTVQGAVDFPQDFRWLVYYYFARAESLVADNR